MPNVIVQENIKLEVSSMVNNMNDGHHLERSWAIGRAYVLYTVSVGMCISTSDHWYLLDLQMGSCYQNSLSLHITSLEAQWICVSPKHDNMKPGTNSDKICRKMLKLSGSCLWCLL